MKNVFLFGGFIGLCFAFVALCYAGDASWPMGTADGSWPMQSSAQQRQIVGETPEQIIQLLGKPDRIVTNVSDNGVDETWFYGTTIIIWFVNGHVKSCTF